MCVYVFPGCLLSKEWACKSRYNLNIFHVRITSRRFARQGAMAAAVDANAPLIELSRDREVQDPPGIIYHIADAAHLHCAIEAWKVERRLED
jgi:hypothetical protein